MPPLNRWRTTLLACLLLGACHSAERPADLAMTVSDLNFEIPDLRHARDLAAPDLECPTTDLPSLDLSVGMHDPTEHPPEPLLTKKNGGTVIASVEAWIVVWEGDEAIGATAHDVVAWMVTSDYWSILAQYGCGPGQAIGVVVLPGSGPATDANVADYVAPALAAGGIVANENTALVFVMPKTTVFGGSYYGRHDRAGTVPFAYVSQVAGVGLAHALSHELAELVTDPNPSVARGWTLGASNREIADVCSGDVDIPVGGDGGTAVYTVTRLYSNAQAQSGTTYGCVPNPQPIEFGVFVVSTTILNQYDHNDRCNVGTTVVQLRPYSLVGTPLLHWKIGSGTPGVTFEPSEGETEPGTDVFVTLVDEDHTTALVTNLAFVYIDSYDPATPTHTITDAVSIDF